MSTGSSAHLGLVGSTGTTVLLLVGALLVLGVAMVAVTVWLVRSTRTDHVALGPLEVMGDRSFRRADEGLRTTRLTTARPDGAPDPAPIVPLDEAEDPVPVDAPVPVDDDATAEPARGRVAEPVPVERLADPAPVEPIEVVGAGPRRPGRWRRRTGGGRSSLIPGGYHPAMAAFDVDEMLGRFRDRAAAVKRRPLPPVAGEERQQFIAQAQADFQDFAMIGDAAGTIEDGVLVLRVDLRPKPDA